MALFYTHRDRDLLLGIWKTDETVEQLRLMLSADSRYNYEGQIKHFPKERKREWLAVRVLLKVLCGEEKIIAYYSSHRPYLEDGSWHISISHTRGYVAVVLHRTCEVGADIELYDRRVQRVASRFIRQDEKDTLSVGDEVYALLLHWCAKETLYKLIDCEGVDFIRHLHVFPFVPTIREGMLEACEYRTPHKGHYVIRYLIYPDFVFTWAIK